MINRVLIRIRVVQILFSCCQGETRDLRKGENELLFSLQKSYDLYHYLLLLLIELTDVYDARVDARKSKLLPTHEDMNPNTRLLDNQFVEQLRKNQQLQKYIKERPFLWREHDAFLRNLLDNIIASDIYKEYLDKAVTDYNDDREFWRSIFKNIICANEELYDLLEDESLYWNDDIEIVESFVLKTIKRFEKTNNADQELLPMFKDDTDREFAVKLFRESVLNEKEYRETINKYTKNWESERIAFMDMLIMQIAMAELVSFPSIPISVTLNEYINIAKSYSTQKSAAFVNGILDSIVNDLKAENKIIKK
jgi:N utilization substance protein B